MTSKLVLEDGSVIEGISFGAQKSVAGEVVFSTGMVGYPESFTDPSYAGQILILTYPIIGNYGVPNNTYWESEKIQISGLIVSNYIDTPSHFQSKMTLSCWLKKEKIPALEITDTRLLTQKIRTKGVSLGKIIIDNDIPFYDPNVENLVAKVSTKEVVTQGVGKKTILLFDCGAKENIKRSLLKRGLRVITVPWDFDPFVKNVQFDMLIISNGPGDPKMATKTIATIKKALQREVPILGVCLGHQLLALAAGGDTYKLKFGHRSQNQPCLLVGSKRCYITTQNHGFAVGKIPPKFKPWFVNANDGSNEGLIHEKLPVMSVQFHPESTSPTPTPRPATPTPTPIPTSSEQISCRYLSVRDEERKGQRAPFTASYTGSPAKVILWAKPASQTRDEGWTQLTKVSAGRGETNGEYDTSILTPDTYDVTMQLLNAADVVIDEKRPQCSDKTTIVSSDAPPPGGGTATLYEIHIQNTDGGSGGHGARRFTGKADLDRFFADPYWKLNPTGSGTTRTVEVVFYARDASGNPLQTATTGSITLTGGGQPAATPIPPRTPNGCELKPSTMETPNLSDDLYRWIQVNRTDKGGEALSSCNDDHLNDSVCVQLSGDTNAEKNGQCPQNTSQHPKVIKEDSNWCRSTPGGEQQRAHCWQLRYIGDTAGQPAATPVPAGQATPTPTRIPGQPAATPTVTPTNTPIPTPTPSETAPLPGPASVTFSVTLSGIGQLGATGTPQARNNPNPVQTRRGATLYLYAPGDDPTGDSTGDRAKYVVPQPQALVFDGSGKFVATNFNLGDTFLPGQYQILIKTPRYLRKRIPGIQTINAGSNTISQQVTLVLGDANNDNSLNIDDYHAYLSCLSKQTADCIAKADFNDDGKVDTVTPVPDFSDHALFTSQFDIIEGD